MVQDQIGMTVYMTGPAGIVIDTLSLFSRADLVLILSTVGIILVLLIVIYLSPLLALIPLLATYTVFICMAANYNQDILKWNGEAE